MFVIYGRRFYGKVDAFDGIHVATQFAHLQFVPLVPIASHIVLEHDGRTFRSIPVPLDVRSVVAAYARVWGVAAATMLTLGVYFRAGREPDLAFAMTLFALAAGLGAAVAFAFVGHLSEDERAQRLVYKRFFQRAVDVARVGDVRGKLADVLKGVIAERAGTLVASAYRSVGDPIAHWREIAVDPSVDDAELFDAALTLARIEGSMASGPAASSFHETHRAIWARVREARIATLRAHEREPDPALGTSGRVVGAVVAAAVVGVLTMSWVGAASAPARASGARHHQR